MGAKSAHGGCGAGYERHCLQLCCDVCVLAFRQGPRPGCPWYAGDGDGGGCVVRCVCREPNALAPLCIELASAL